ncbi:MAG: hypothetical protein PVJ29_17160 [Desulfobacterales bacterium]|jgi:hypothetical protein
MSRQSSKLLGPLRRSSLTVIRNDRLNEKGLNLTAETAKTDENQHLPRGLLAIRPAACIQTPMVTMTTKEAILAFSQSEKIKSGIIWVTQALGVLSGLPEKNRKSAERIAHVFIGLMLRDVHLAVRVTADPTWRDVEKNIDLALVMLDSGVSQEAGYHLTRALSHVTDIGQRSMSELKDRGLL